MKIEQDKFYTLKEMGGFLFSSRTWERRIRAGEVTHLKDGIILVKGSWINEYIKRKTKKATGDAE